MDELIYEYVKGQGWVLGPEIKQWTTEHKTNYHGTWKVTLVDRYPKVGERYYTGLGGYTDHNKQFIWDDLWDGLQQDMELWPDSMGGCIYSELDEIAIAENKYNTRIVTIITERVP